MKSFKELSLPLELDRALTGMNFHTPTPIQALAIPVALMGRDLIGCAQTGTGKTAAFCIPLIVNLAKNPAKTALILAPTRELAMQIETVFKTLSKNYNDMRAALLIGGASMGPQFKALRAKPRVLVATPGRLMDHLRQRSVSLAKAEILVLDEADRMLDMGFAPQLNEILRFIPKNRQTMLFSATMPEEIRKLAAKYLHNPERVTVGTVSQPARTISQSIVETTQSNKNKTLVDELGSREGSVLIFARTKRRTDRVAKFLYEGGYRVSRIHGDRTQKQRNDAIEGFRNGKFNILVATDIAARGIDISHIAHVINYDLPAVAEDYIHRIGRTGRAGAEGKALSFVTPEDRGIWRDITRLLAKTKPANSPATARNIPAAVTSRAAL